MNKKNLIILICCLVVLIGSAILFANINKKENKNTEYQNNYISEESKYNANEDLKPLAGKYETDNLNINEKLANLNNKILDISMCNSFETNILTKEHKIYRYNSISMKLEFLTDVNSTAQKFSDIAGSMSVYNIDGTYSFYSGENKYEKVSLQNPIYVSIGGMEKIIITLENSKLYLTVYSKNNEIKINHEPLDINIGGAVPANICTAGVVDIYDYDGINHYVLLQNGELYSNIKLGYGENTGRNYSTSTNLNKPNLTNVSRIFGKTEDFYKPICTLMNDYNNIYTYQFATYGNMEDTKIKIKLPINCKTTDIKDVYMKSKLIVLETNGKEIYTADNFENITEWKLNEELTRLNKENHIIKFISFDNNITVLMDDGNIYTVKI